MRPLYILSAFWGERFRSYFSHFTLPSLLAPGNLGSLSAKDGHRLLIATTAADWKALNELPIMAAIARHAMPCLIAIGLPGEIPDPTTAKFRHMSYAHRLLAELAHRDGALASLIMPDQMYTDGSLAAAVRHVENGAHAVLTFGPRLIEESLFAELRDIGVLPGSPSGGSDGTPIVLNSRAVAGPAGRNLYYDTFNCYWEATDFQKWPPFCIWRAPDGAGILVHCYYHWFVLLDFSAIKHHETRAFDTAAIENSWLADNYPDPARVHVIGDSDEAMVISWTPAPAVPPVGRPQALLRIPVLGAICKGFRLRCMREFHAIIGDFQKANVLRYPVRWHCAEFDAAWAATEARSRRIMLWFFGDVYEEFATDLPFWQAALFKPWWLLLRSVATLRASIQAAMFAVSSRLKPAICRSVLRLKFSK